MRLRMLAPAKVNLSLFLGATRADGRHRLVTLLESVSLADELVAEAGGQVDEVICPGVDGDNLAARALAALRARGWDGPPMRVTIEKRIPVAAGMAGGSADAAATLRLAMALAPGRAEEVEAIAVGLGSDVPSQLLPGVAIGTGAGELVEHFEPLAQHAFVVVPSSEALSTADVYREADRLAIRRNDAQLASRYLMLLEAVEAGAALPSELVVNDLQQAAISLCPSIEGVLDKVRSTGAAQVLVSGSGPTVVGLWWGPAAVQQASGAAAKLVVDHPGAVLATPVDAAFAAPDLR